jgi:hypothetical protein
VIWNSRPWHHQLLVAAPGDLSRVAHVVELGRHQEQVGIEGRADGLLAALRGGAHLGRAAD